MEALRELRDLIARQVGSDSIAVPESSLLGLKFTSATRTSGPVHIVYEPCFALVVQGKKRIMLGDKLFACGAGQFLIVSVDLPLTIQITAATRDEPFMALAVPLKPEKIATLLLEAAAADRFPAEVVGMGVSDAPREIVEAVTRLARLADHPRDVPILGPVAEREILWRLLCGEQGHRVRHIGLADSRLSQIGRAIRWMRDNYSSPLKMEDLARLSAMSVTSFHRHFRAVSLMSPLQYLKQIRLQEARAQLLAGADNVATVGHGVGYESASQFSREYKRAYGAPPTEDARVLRGPNGTPHKTRRRRGPRRH